MLVQGVPGAARWRLVDEAPHRVAPAKDVEQVDGQRVGQTQQVEAGAFGERGGDQAVQYRPAGQLGPDQLERRGLQLVEGVQRPHYLGGLVDCEEVLVACRVARGELWGLAGHGDECGSNVRATGGCPLTCGSTGTVAEMELAEVQSLMEDLYGEADRDRGVPATVAWLCEELGELAQATRKGTPDQQLHELGDVLAWLASLANQLDLSLDEAMSRYVTDPP